MEKLSYEQIKEILNSNLLEEADLGPTQFMQEELTDLESLEEGELKDLYAKLGSFKVVKHYGGEGQGDNYYTVYHFQDHDVYIKFDGWYSSYEGAEYDYMHQVFPKEVTEIKYLP